MCGADGGVALDVLHRAHARTRPRGRGRRPWRRAGRRRTGARRGGGSGTRHSTRPAPGGRGPDRTSPGMRAAAVVESELPSALDSAASRPLRRHPGRSKTPSAEPDDVDAVEWLAGHERAEGVVVAQLAARLAEQVHRRIPAAADQQHVAGHRLPRRLSGGRQTAAWVMRVVAAGAADHRSEAHRDAAGRALVDAGPATRPCGRRRPRRSARRRRAGRTRRGRHCRWW